MSDGEAATAPGAEEPKGAETLLERRGPIAILTLSNPARRNAFSPESRRQLVAYLQELAVDREIRAIVLTGAGDHFCTGADLARASKTRAAGVRSAIDMRQHAKEVLTLLRALAGGPKPVIAAVEGDAFGGGLAFAAASDVLVCAKNARFGTAFTSIGLLPDLGLLFTLQQRMGPQRARTMLMLSGRMNGEEAYRTGLADEVVEPGQALTAALVWAEKFLTVAPIAVTMTKEALGTGITSIEDVIRVEADLVPLMSTTQDNKEGIRAFMEKRKPEFQGL